MRHVPRIALAATFVIVVLQQGTALGSTGTADISVSVSRSAEPTTATADLTYTIKATNNGPDPATSTNISDTLPAEVMLISVGGAGKYDPSLNRVTWHLGTLDAGQVRVRTVVIRPIHPSHLTNSVNVTTTSSDPTPNTVTTLSNVVAEPGVEYISVRDTGIKPTFHSLPLGDTLQWDFYGPGLHEITDSNGLGLFDTGPVKPVNYYRYTFNLSAEIRTMDIGWTDQPPDLKYTGKIVVPVQVSPPTGDQFTQFTVTWALSTLPPGFVEDIQIKRPGFTTWETFQHGTSALNDPSFVADAGPGTYSFRDRIRNTVNKTHSRFGPPVPLEVTE
jgi:uncharacterized repeat protein (TIGR01451 family)